MSVRNDDERYELQQGDALYPASLTDLPDAPKRLYVRGNPEALSCNALAVIGSRKVTPYGLATTELAVRMACASNIAIVSGGAIGCDQCAGLEALKQGGVNIVVLGCGADVVYPASSADLIQRTIEQGGAIVSIVPWGTNPRPYLFPQRNRIIAALARAVFVGEAGIPSGTFSTAETASSIGREVLAVPGSIFSPNSQGTNYLISNGACCIADEEALEIAISRIYGTLCFCHGAAAAPDSDGSPEHELMRALIASPMRSDAIARMLGLDPRGCLELLSSLMVDGLVEQLVDGRYAPTKSVLHAKTVFGHNTE